MNDSAASLPNFLRRTHLNSDEQHINFSTLDDDAIWAVTSTRARAVSALVPHVYLRLCAACGNNRRLVLKGRAINGDKKLTAWEELLEIIDVSAATAQKILLFLHDQFIIGLVRDDKGATIKIYLNHAANSVSDLESRD